MKENNGFVKNPKTGVVFAKTAVLAKMRKDLIPCTEDGIPVSYNTEASMPYLFNPFTSEIIPYGSANAQIQGLIPCRDEEHASEIKDGLMSRMTSNDDSSNEVTDEPKEIKIEGSQGLSAPELKTSNQEDTALIEKLRLINTDNMDKSQLKEFALEHFSEKLNGQKGADTLREELQVLINDKISEAA